MSGLPSLSPVVRPRHNQLVAQAHLNLINNNTNLIFNSPSSSFNNLNLNSPNYQYNKYNHYHINNNNNQLINSPINNVYNTTNNTKSLTPKRKIQVANSNVRNKKYKKNLCDMNEFNLIENYNGVVEQKFT